MRPLLLQLVRQLRLIRTAVPFQIHASGSFHCSAKPESCKEARMTCPICAFSTGVHHAWKDRKRNHRAKWHPEFKIELRLAKRSLPSMIKWSENTCCWKCPLCEQGVPKTVTNKDVEYKMRLQHAKTQHPKAKSTRFLRKKGTNFLKARAAKTAAGNAKKLLDIKSGASGQHGCEISQVPSMTKGKKVGRSLNQLFCKKCKALAVSAAAIAKIPCEGNYKGGPKRLKLLNSLERFQKKLPIGSNERDAVQKVIAKLRPPEPSNGDAEVAHDIIADSTAPADMQECQGAFSDQFE